MATVRPNSYISDVVSILFYTNKKLRRYLLVDCKELLTLPCSKVLGENWSETADYLLDSIIGKRLQKKILKIIKVWVPSFPRKHVYHVVFSVEIPTNVDEKNSQLFSLADIKEAMKHAKLCSPEILNYALLCEKYNGDAESNDERNLDTLHTVNNDFLTEVTEKDVLFLHADPGYEKYLELLKSADIALSEQRCLYTEFILNSFPYLYMNAYEFIHYVADMKWEKDDAFSLFRSADLHGRGALSFQDFLFIFAACCRNVAHTGVPAEIRSKYIFRFFDDNSDGLLNYDNFTSLIQQIRIAKKLPSDAASVSEEVQKYESSIGISSTVSMSLMQFVAAVGDLKLRGTSTLLRFPKSVKEYLFSKGSNQIKASTYKLGSPSQVNTEATPSVENKKTDSPLVDTNSFNISTHTLKIKNSGAFIDIDEIWSQHDWVSPSSSKLLKSTKDKSSIERFNQASAPNEIINFLKYFSQPSPVDGKSKMSWGPFDMKKLGNIYMIQTLKNKCMKSSHNQNPSMS